MAELGHQRPKGTLAPRHPFFWAQVGVAAAFVVLLGRLWQLQILGGEHYYRKSADNFVKELELPAPRGAILDHGGAVLAENRPSWQVVITPRFVTDAAQARLAQILKLDDEAARALKARLAAKRGLDRYKPLVVFDEITRDQMGAVESLSLDLPGVQIGSGSRRAYPGGAMLAHALGYLNQVTAEEIASKRGDGYHLGDYIGRAGIERQWEAILRGTPGTERIVVDAKGQRKPEVETEELLGGPQHTDPTSGSNIVVTFDVPLQREVERVLRHWRSAAAVVVDVDTGRVLAMASQPGYDPNQLSGRLSRADAERLLGDERHPLLDKTVGGTYYPGSTFKIVPMLAALHDESVDVDERVICRGAIQYGRRSFHCVEAHGPVNLHKALAASCNVYFYGLGETVGLDRMAEVATQLGLGVPTGIGLNNEQSGFVPTMEFYKKAGGFQRGFVLNTAIGQGSVKVTLLEVAMAYAAIANGGRLMVPQIIERIEAPSGQVLEEFPPRLRHQLPFDGADLARVRAALTDAVNDEIGTAWSTRLVGAEVAGKTGTAQVGDHRVKDANGELTADHGWFAAFAPAAKPEIAVVALVEHGGFGAKSAAPVAMEIFRSWFRLRHGLETKVVVAKPRPKHVFVKKTPAPIAPPSPTAPDEAVDDSPPPEGD